MPIVSERVSHRTITAGLAVVVIGLIAVLALPNTSRWESTAFVASDSFEINRARIPRTAVTLLRGTSHYFGERATVLPIEGSGLVAVTFRAATADQAEDGLQLLLGMALQSLNSVGPDIGSFVQVTDAVTQQTSTGPGFLGAVLFMVVGVSSLSLSVSGTRALVRRETSPTGDGHR